MIKGVNKKVLEINNPRSIYFEKAVFYLKPNMGVVPEKLVTREAQSLLMSIGHKPPKCVVHLKLVLKIAAAVSIISVIGGVLFFLLK